MKINSWVSALLCLFVAMPLLLSVTSLGAGIDHDHKLYVIAAFTLAWTILQLLNTNSLAQGNEIRRLSAELDALKSKMNPAQLGSGGEIEGQVVVLKGLNGSMARHYRSGRDSTQQS